MPGLVQGLLGTEGLTDVPFLILGNKIDVPQAASEDEIRGALGLHNMTTGKVRYLAARNHRREVISMLAQGKVPMSAGVRPVEIFCCSVVKRMGYKEGAQTAVNRFLLVLHVR